MTALTKYSRLEASGVWLESPESEPIEVLVSLGKASLILYNYEDTPLTHWSLSSIKLVSQIDTEGIFSTTEEGLETLKIDDIYMVDALLNFINNPKEKKITPRLSSKLFITVAFIVLISLFLYVPPKLPIFIETIISKDHESQITEPYLRKHIDRYGPKCTSKLKEGITDDILESIGDSDDRLTITILKNQDFNVLHLPSGQLLVSGKFLQGLETADLFLQLLVSELINAQNRAPLKTLLKQQSLYSLVRFLLGLESEILFQKVSEFEVQNNAIKSHQNFSLSDFYWVALQNTCLN